ncbi:MAG: HD domain-containing protein [Candidatus Glassbacteria bacterium]|nr:HD domain-containing protein [Candidatus Glassbacteria bacterium]
MKKLLRDHAVGEAVDCICLLAAVQAKKTRKDKPYLRFEFGDAGGRVPGVMWEGFDEQLAGLPPGEVVRVLGRMDQWEDRPQLAVQSIHLPPPGSYQPTDLLPSSERNLEQMLGELDRIVESIKFAPLRKLLGGMFAHGDFRNSFSRAPAAKRWHQPYLGGLLEHTLNVHYHALNMAGRYPQVELDMVSAGALVHDIGKTVEYNVEDFFNSSTRGRLLGHLVIGVEILDSWIRKVEDFPEEAGWHLKHVILSHHGHYEFGSPVVPRTLEALIVHFADDLDAKINGVLRIYQRESRDPGDWTSYVRLMEREFFKSRVLPGGETAGESPPAGPPEAKPGRTRPAEEQPDFFDNGDDERNREGFPQ